MSCHISKLRVLHVVTSMNAGGIETMLMNYYRHIDRSKVQFDFLTHRREEGYFDAEIISLGGRIYHVPSAHPKDYFPYMKALTSFFSEHKEYSIMHAHINYLSMYSLRAAKYARIPVRIAHSHMSQSRLRVNLRLPVKLYTRARLGEFCTERFACGEAAGKYLFGDNDFKVLQNGIYIEAFSFSAEKRKKVQQSFHTENKLIIGHVGTFNSAKNHQFIIKIFAEVCRLGLDPMLLLVGSGARQNEIKQAVKANNLSDRVIFTGIRSDVSDLMQAMDIFLFPSLFEGFPVTLVEAQAAGLPCVVSDQVPKEVSITDLVEFVPLNKSPEEWAKIVLEKAKSTTRRDYGEEVKKAGFDVRENAKWLQEFYLARHREAMERKR